MMNVDKLLKAGKDYAKSQMTPENLLKASTKFQGKQKNPNAPVNATQGTPTAQPIEQASTMGKYLPYIVGGLLLVVVVFFVMKKK
jgi:hypothetical protein